MAGTWSQLPSQFLKEFELENVQAPENSIEDRVLGVDWEVQHSATLLSNDDDELLGELDMDGDQEYYAFGSLIQKSGEILWNAMVQDPSETTLISTMSRVNRLHMIQTLGKQVEDHKAKLKTIRNNAQQSDEDLRHALEKQLEMRKRLAAILAEKERADETVQVLRLSIESSHREMYHHRVSIVRKKVLVNTAIQLRDTSQESKPFGKNENLPIQTIRPCVHTSNASATATRDRVIDYFGFGGEWQARISNPVPAQSVSDARIAELERQRDELDAFIAEAKSAHGGAADSRTEEEDSQPPRSEDVSADQRAPPQV